MTNQTILIDRLWQVSEARKGLTSLLQACETSPDALELVQPHQVGHILELFEEIEKPVFEQLQHLQH